MAAGKFRHKVQIQRWMEGIQDPETGDITSDWVDLKVVNASVEPLSVKEFIQSSAGQSQITARIKMRYRDVKASDRILHRGKIYNVTGVLPDPRSGLEYVTCPVTEGVNNG